MLKRLIILISSLLISCSTSSRSQNSSLEIFSSTESDKCQYFIDVASRQKTNKILFIGDSHAVGLFGKELFNRLQSKYPLSELYFYAVCGSSPNWWLNGTETQCGYWQLDSKGHEIKTIREATPDLKELIQNIKPNLIIIEQGTNLIRLKPVDVKQQVIQLIDVIKAMTPAQIVWVGPPDARAYSKQAINSTFLTLLDVCSEQRPKIKLIDSRKFTHYPASANDGVHYYGSDGELENSKWANGIVSDIE